MPTSAVAFPSHAYAAAAELCSLAVASGQRGQHQLEPDRRHLLAAASSTALPPTFTASAGFDPNESQGASRPQCLRSRAAGRQWCCDGLILAARTERGLVTGRAIRLRLVSLFLLYTAARRGARAGAAVFPGKRLMPSGVPSWRHHPVGAHFFPSTHRPIWPGTRTAVILVLIATGRLSRSRRGFSSKRQPLKRATTPARRAACALG